MTKKGKNRPTGTYDGSSNNMETHGTSIVIQQMKEHEIFDDINRIVKDRDNKSGKLLDEVGVSDLIVNDPGHYRKNFEKAFDQMVQENRKFSYYNDEGELIKINHPFYGMKNHIIKWINTCLKEHDQDTRVAMWISCIPHYLGDHSNCNHSDDKVNFFWQTGVLNDPIAQIFIDFVNEQAKILRNVSTEYSTQAVESLNASYGRHAPKKFNCNRIRRRRASAVILQNDPEMGPFLIRQCCNSSPLSQVIQDEIKKDSQDIIKRRIKSYESEVMRKKNISRLKWKNKYKTDPNGDHGNGQ